MKITKTDGNEQFCSYMNRHSLCHTSYNSIIHSRRGCRIIPRCSEIIIVRVPPQVELQACDITGACGRGNWSAMANPYARKCPYILTPVWERTIVCESEWLQLFQRWNHAQLEHVTIRNSYDGLKKLWPMIHACINNSQKSTYLFWLSRSNLLQQDFVNVLYNYTFKARCLSSITSVIKQFCGLPTEYGSQKRV